MSARRVGLVGLVGLLSTLPMWTAAARPFDAADVAARIRALSLAGVDDASAYGRARVAAARCPQEPLSCELAEATLALAAARAMEARLRSTAAALGVVVERDGERPTAPAAPPATVVEPSSPAVRLDAPASEAVRARLRSHDEASRNDPAEQRPVRSALIEALRALVGHLDTIARVEASLATRVAPEPPRGALELAREHARRTAEEAAAADDAYRARRRR